MALLTTSPGLSPPCLPLALLSLAAAFLALAEGTDDALGQDDECTQNECALNALQRRGVLASTQDEGFDMESKEGAVALTGLGSEDTEEEEGDLVYSHNLSDDEDSNEGRSGPRLRHYAQNCWWACHRRSGPCEHFCGKSNSCCRWGMKNQPLECRNVIWWSVRSFHTCVRSRNMNPEVKIRHELRVTPPPEPTTTLPPWSTPPPQPYAYTGVATDTTRVEIPIPEAEENERSKFDIVQKTVTNGIDRYLPEKPMLAYPSEAPLLTFYVYRAMGLSGYPPENVNAASAEGVMWYLHNEIVRWVPRRFGVTRVMRFKIEYKPTQPMHDAGLNFGVRQAYDSGMCTGPGNCQKDYDDWGFFVGCNKVWQFPTWQFKDAALYSSELGDPVWYSFPGWCSDHTFNQHTEPCQIKNPGGACFKTPTGRGNCTYHHEYAGYVNVDDFTGIGNYSTFVENGGREYIPGLGSNACPPESPKCDRGVGTSFWDEKENPAKNKDRVQAMLDAFKKKYPQSDFLPSIPCDFSSYRFQPSSIPRAASR